MFGEGGRTFDSCVHWSRSSSIELNSPNGLNIPPISPDLPTALFTESKPEPTNSLAPTTPATELVTLPSTLYAPVTARFPVATVWTMCSAVSRRG